MKSQEITKNGTTLIFAPLSITSCNSQELKDSLITQLEKCTNININLQNTTEFDISGLQIVQALKNYSILNGIEVEISNISESVKSKLNILGVNL